MLHQTRSLLVASLLLALAPALNAQTPPPLPEGGKVAEVHVLSLQFSGGRSASLVGRPCDKYETCADIIARIDAKTTWRDNGVLISYQEAKTLDWNGAVLITDKFNNALLLSRIPVGEEE